MEEKNKVLDIIIDFVKGLKSKDKSIEAHVNGTEYKINSCRYLLSQILRQWNLSDDKLYVSNRAMELWKKLSNDNINDYTYVKKVTCVNEEPIEVKIYTGSKNVYEVAVLKKGSKFKFNSIFHEDHIVPVNMIMNELCDLKELTYENVEKVLDKIAICRILKEEDKLLNAHHSKSKRPGTIQEVLENVYDKVGITILKK